jgi:hypothetical protein
MYIENNAKQLFEDLVERRNAQKSRRPSTSVTVTLDPEEYNQLIIMANQLQVSRGGLLSRLIHGVVPAAFPLLNEVEQSATGRNYDRIDLSELEAVAIEAYPYKR